MTVLLTVRHIRRRSTVRVLVYVVGERSPRILRTRSEL